MAKRQRGETTALSKTAKNGKEWVEHFELTLGSSDDEVPEEVTFKESKAEALENRKQALDIARREKELLKEKRRKKQELFQEQKKWKLLPTDVLEEIDSASSQKQKQTEAAVEEQHEEGEEEEQHRRKKRSKKLAHSRNLKGNYTVATLKVPSMESYQLQVAEDFIQSRLYGPGSCRTTSNELLSLENKKGKNKSAAVQFVKKDWACKEKAKAEKLKKRWSHKQQIPFR